MQVSCLQDRSSSTVILQPHSLSGVSGQSFQESLEAAIAKAPAIIVDLLWVETVDREGLQLLVQALLRSKREGKDLTFLGLEHQAQVEIDRQINQGQKREPKDSYSIFAPEFEAFLDRHRDSRSSEALV
jgi:anti-anti-sigma regulatory factor